MVVSASVRDLHLALARADRLDEHQPEAAGVEHGRGVHGRHRQPTRVAAGGHRPDEHAVVRGVLLHPHPVAQDGAAGDGAGRVDGQDRDRSDACARASATSAVTRVLLPAPGGPVMPTRWAAPASG